MKNKAENSFEGVDNYTKKKMVIASMTLMTVFMLILSGCKKSDDLIVADNQDQTANAELRTSHGVTYLVSDEASYHPSFVDPNLVNAWGMSFTPSGQVWVNSTEKGVATIYDMEGDVMMRPIIIPFGDAGGRAHPTGSVTSPEGARFAIRGADQLSKMIFSTEEGTIAAWGSGAMATIVADRSNVHAVYKGLAVANNDGRWMLYATDFHNRRIDVFNEKFELVASRGFDDPRIPDTFSPFGIRGFGSKLIVTYAMRDEKGEDDVAGPGNGYVDLYRADGMLLRGFAEGGSLNSPWGIEMYTPARTPAAQTELSPDIERRIVLIGNFGDGHINIFDQTGNCIGQLQGHEGPITIDGLWSISYKPGHFGEATRLYFTAGPADEAHGLFGFISN